MKPTSFKEANVLYADKNSTTLPMPAFRENNNLLICWKMNLIERIRALFCKRIWIIMKTRDANEIPQMLLTTKKSDLIKKADKDNAENS